MDRAKWIVVAVVVAAVVTTIVALGRDTSGGGVVDNAQLRALATDGIRLVDVRTTSEYELGHIPGSENVPVDEIASRVAEWDASAPIIVYCATGARSAQAASTLRSLGFKTVYDLGGGVAQWDGDIEQGTPAEASAVPAVAGGPVLYEFYTDW